ERDLDPRERLRDGAAGLRLLGHAGEVLRGQTGNDGRDVEVAAGDALAGHERHRRRRIDARGRRAVLGQDVREGHAVARRVGRGDELLGLRDGRGAFAAGVPVDRDGPLVRAVEGDVALSYEEGALTRGRGFTRDAHAVLLPGV